MKSSLSLLLAVASITSIAITTHAAAQPAIPPPQFEPGGPPPPPGPPERFVLEPGHWAWGPNVHHYVWEPRHWVAIRRGYVHFVPGHWQFGQWIPAHWGR